MYLPLTQKEMQVIYSPHLLHLIGGHLNKIPKEFIFNKENSIEDSFMKSENFFSAPTLINNQRLSYFNLSLTKTDF